MEAVFVLFLFSIPAAIVLLVPVFLRSREKMALLRLVSTTAESGQPIAAVPIVTAPTMTAMDADTAALSLPMAAYPNPFAAVPSAGVESTHDELGRNL